MSIELNIKGLRKALPFLEKLSEDVYDGGINMRIGYDGQLRMDAKNPIALMEIASGYGINILYSGTDRHNDYCYDVIAEAPEGPPMATTSVNATAPGNESRPDPKKDAEEAAKAAEEREQRFLEQLNLKFAEKWPQYLDEFGQTVEGIFADMDMAKKLKSEVNPPQL